jgi:hypothetical protein
MILLRLFVLAAVLCDGVVLGVEDLIEYAKQQAVSYSLEAEFGLDEYQMIADISVEASPDSELLFNSKATMELLETKDLRLESFDCTPKIATDDRSRANNGKGVEDYGAFGRRERYERITIDGKVFDLRDIDGKRKIPKFSEPVHEGIMRYSTNCVKPFDWPIHGPSSFDGRVRSKDYYKFTFGTDRKCIFATQRAGGLLETHWTKPVPSINAIRSITFKEELPVCSELHLFGRKVDPQKYELKSGVRLIKTETTWGEFRDTFVPKTVVSQIYAQPGIQQRLLLVARISIYSTGDNRFEERKEQALKLATTIDRTK